MAIIPERIETPLHKVPRIYYSPTPPPPELEYKMCLRQKRTPFLYCLVAGMSIGVIGWILFVFLTSIESLILSWLLIISGGILACIGLIFYKKITDDLSDISMSNYKKWKCK